MGRLKRNKTYRKFLQFYDLNFQIRPPYRVLLDGNFLHAAVQNSVLVRDKVPALLGDAQASLLVPTAVVQELTQLGEPVAAATALAQTFKSIKYGGGSTAAAAIQALVGTRNKHKYIVCTQDAALRDTLARVPGVPLVYLNHCALVLEPPSRTSRDAHQQREAKKVVPTRDERRRLQQAHTRTTDAGTARPRPSAGTARRRGPQAPNPLSVKKRTRAPPSSDASSGTRRRRKRVRPAASTTAPTE